MLDTKFQFEVIISRSHGGGVHFSAEAERMIAALKGFEITVDENPDSYTPVVIKGGYEAPSEKCARNDPVVIQVLRELGARAKFSNSGVLEIHTIEAGVNVENFDGFENIENGYAYSTGKIERF